MQTTGLASIAGAAGKDNYWGNKPRNGDAPAVTPMNGGVFGLRPGMAASKAGLNREGAVDSNYAMDRVRRMEENMVFSVGGTQEVNGIAVGPGVPVNINGRTEFTDPRGRITKVLRSTYAAMEADTEQENEYYSDYVERWIRCGRDGGGAQLLGTNIKMYKTLVAGYTFESAGTALPTGSVVALIGATASKDNWGINLSKVAEHMFPVTDRDGQRVVLPMELAIQACDANTFSYLPEQGKYRAAAVMRIKYLLVNCQTRAILDGDAGISRDEAGKRIAGPDVLITGAGDSDFTDIQRKAIAASESGATNGRTPPAVAAGAV